MYSRHSSVLRQRIPTTILPLLCSRFTSSAPSAHRACQTRAAWPLSRRPFIPTSAVDYIPLPPSVMRLPRDEHRCAGRPGTSHLRTLSPIIASPRTSTFFLDSSASNVDHDSPPCTQSPPILVSLPSTMASLESTPPHTGSRSLSEALYAPSSLSTSTSYPAAVFLRTVHGVVATPEETRHHVRPRPRSFSLPSRQRPEILQITNAKDINVSFPRRRAKCHIPLGKNTEDDEGAPPLGFTQNPETFVYGNMETGDNSLRDATRSFHALMELLTSECGYVNDLKALVQVSGFAPSQEYV